MSRFTRPVPPKFGAKHKSDWQALSLPLKFVAGFGAALIVLAFLAFFLGLGGLVTLALWNLVLVPVVKAVGLGTIPKISFWVAVGINLVWGVITRPFRRETPSASA